MRLYGQRGDSLPILKGGIIMFRKITALFVAFLLIFSLTGCVFIPSWKQVDVRYDTSEIVSVELYYLTGSYDGRFYGLEEDIDQMEEELDPIDALDAEQYEEFVKDLESIEGVIRVRVIK